MAAGKQALFARAAEGVPEAAAALRRLGLEAPAEGSAAEEAEAARFAADTNFGVEL